jgi:hypothetical protein
VVSRRQADAYVETRTNSFEHVIRVVTLATGQDDVLTAGEAPAWSLDGNSIVYHLADNHLHVLNLLTGTSNMLVQGFSGDWAR